MRISSGYEAKKARVEMLPLIDVVFLLLVFFIYAMVSMVVHRGIQIDLPSAGTATLESEDYISITIDERLFLCIFWDLRSLWSCHNKQFNAVFRIIDKTFKQFKLIL